MSSNGATSTPRRAKTCQSNLTFWPIFSTPGSSSSGLSSAIASRFVDLAGQQTAAAEEIGGAGAMADRNVAGFARRHGERDADEIGLQRIERSGFGVEGDEPRFERARDPALGASAASPRSRRPRRRSFPRAPERPAAAARPCGVRSPAGAAAGAAGASGRGGGRSGRSRGRRGVRRDGLAVARRASRPGRQNARRARPRWRRARKSRRRGAVIVVNSIALRKAISGAPSRSGHAERIERDLRRRRRAPASPASSTAGSARPIRDRSATSRRFGCLISLARSSSVSRSPYSPISCAAVLTPMPRAPGTLSVESPASAWMSTTLSAPAPK